MRTKYIWDDDRWTPAQEYYARQRKVEATGYLPDIAPFQSPIDYSEITSRSQLREHEQRHGVRQCGELKSAADFDNRKIKPYEPVVGRRRYS